MIEAVVDQAVERGEPIAGPHAPSEATIYRRFGFGVATRFQTLSIDSRRLRLAEAAGGDRRVGRVPGRAGAPRLAAPSEARRAPARAVGPGLVANGPASSAAAPA